MVPALLVRFSGLDSTEQAPALPPALHRPRKSPPGHAEDTLNLQRGNDHFRDKNRPEENREEDIYTVQPAAVMGLGQGEEAGPRFRSSPARVEMFCARRGRDLVLVRLPVASHVCQQILFVIDVGVDDHVRS